MVTGVLLVHLDWPWSFQRDDISRKNLLECEAVLMTLARSRTDVVAAVLTPQRCKKHRVPKRIKALIDSLEARAGLLVTASDELENVGAFIARSRPEITDWLLGGFWKELCCADVKFGVKQKARVKIPRNWSAFCELKSELSEMRTGNASF